MRIRSHRSFQKVDNNDSTSILHEHERNLQSRIVRLQLTKLVKYRSNQIKMIHVIIIVNNIFSYLEKQVFIP